MHCASSFYSGTPVAGPAFTSDGLLLSQNVLFKINNIPLTYLLLMTFNPQLCSSQSHGFLSRQEHGSCS